MMLSPTTTTSPGFQYILVSPCIVLQPAWQPVFLVLCPLRTVGRSKNLGGGALPFQCFEQGLGYLPKSWGPPLPPSSDGSALTYPPSFLIFSSYSCKSWLAALWILPPLYSSYKLETHTYLLHTAAELLLRVRVFFLSAFTICTVVEKRIFQSTKILPDLQNMVTTTEGL